MSHSKPASAPILSTCSAPKVTTPAAMFTAFEGCLCAVCCNLRHGSRSLKVARVGVYLISNTSALNYHVLKPVVRTELKLFFICSFQVLV